MFQAFPLAFMSHFFFNTIVITIVITTQLCLNEVDAQLSNKTNIHTILNTHENKDTLSFMAVFLLSSLKKSAAFGSPPEKEDEDYFGRVKNAKATWAHPLKHFYSVVGNDDDTLKILTEPKYCQNHTHHYREATRHATHDNWEEVFVCNDIKVLYLPYCDPTSWGPSGPCCRCEGAMRYFLNMAAVFPDHPKWFMFADDDYYVRTYKMQGILSRFDPDHPYVVRGLTDRMSHAGDKDVPRTNMYAMHFYGPNCTIPCTTQSTWLALAVFSMGALRVMEPEIKQRGLVHTCDVWSTTHDVGLGIFAWEHALVDLPICCGAGEFSPQNAEQGTYFHAVGRRKDSTGVINFANDIMQKTWAFEAKKRKEEAPNQHAYILSEHQLGLNQHIDPISMGGFENSLFYRKVQFSEAMAKQIPEKQLNTLKGLPIRRTDFGKEDCQTEMKFFYEWREKSEFPLTEVTLNTVGGSKDRFKSEFHYWRTAFYKHEPKMCASYLEAVANSPVHLSDLKLPPLDDLTRQRQLLRKEEE